jgi:hypothetical protein
MRVRVRARVRAHVNMCVLCSPIVEHGIALDIRGWCETTRSLNSAVGITTVHPFPASTAPPVARPARLSSVSLCVIASGSYLCLMCGCRPGAYTRSHFNST